MLTAHISAAALPLVSRRPLALLAGIGVGALLVPWLIGAQRRGRFGQHVYEDAPKSHAHKQGTPTLGGIAFAAAAIAGYFLGGGAAPLPLLCLVLAAAAIGFADDLLILRKQRALGLRARAKLSLLALVAIGYGFWVYRDGSSSPLQAWFGGTLLLPLGLWFVLCVLAIAGAANAVNLTDGLDGLAVGVTIPVLIGLQLAAGFLGLPGGATITDAILGAMLAFLWYNRYPARIFMGDTGSLALGALLGGIAIQSHTVLLLPLFGAVLVIEAISVIAQVATFKTTGRRILRMSPLHHHFELSGWRETAVTSSFVVASVLAAAATWVTFWSSNKL